MSIANFTRSSNNTHSVYYSTAQKTKFSIKNFFSKCDQICRRLRICSHLLKKSLKKTLFFVQCWLNFLEELKQKMKNKKGLIFGLSSAQKFTKISNTLEDIHYFVIILLRESVVRRCSLKQVFLIAIFIWRHLCWSLFFNEVTGFRPATLFKNETSAQVLVFSCCKIFKNTFF